MDWESWGGSEELWAQTALDLVSQGFSISASVAGWSPPHERILKLTEAGAEVQLRPPYYPLWKRAARKLFGSNNTVTDAEVEGLITAKPPALVIFSAGAPLPSVELLELCASKKLQFVTIGHTNWEGWWPADELACRYRKVLPAARRCYFVSKANQQLTEKQIGCEISNAEVIRNPFNVDFNASLPWPPLKNNGDLHLAFVGRLHPTSKGQDILFEALANPVWSERSWRLTLYGEGPMRNSLQRMVQRLGLQDRVVFAGHVTSVEKIWVENHVLVMPSRSEGMPLAVVEAMLCARAVVATDVAGHSEIIHDGVTGFLADAPTVSSMANTLERLWAGRMTLEAMGKAAAKSIREHVPADPVRVFSEKMKSLAGA